MSLAIKTILTLLIYTSLTLSAHSSVSRDGDDDLNTNEPKTSLASIQQSISILPHDVKSYILSFLSNQKDLLRIGAVSRDWRQVTAKVWEKRWLNLSNKPLTKADYQTLAKGIFPRLRLNEIELKGMDILATCSQLQALDLCLNNLGDAGATALASSLKGMTALKELYLHSNQIGDKGATALAPSLKGMTALTALTLSYNQIGDKGATALAASLKGMMALTTLYLHYNQIRDIGATALAASLKGMTALTTLYLDNNQIGDIGATTLAPSLKGMTALTTLNLYINQIGDKGKKALEEVKRSRPNLTLYY